MSRQGRGAGRGLLAAAEYEGPRPPV